MSEYKRLDSEWIDELKKLNIWGSEQWEIEEAEE